MGINGRLSEYIFAKGKMANSIRAFDWNKTSLGPVGTWPTTLLTLVNQILDSSFPMFIWWGENKIQFCNDSYLQILGTDENSKHPKAFGQKAEECWDEIRPVISPLLNQVLTTGEPVYLEDQLIPIYREGKMDDIYVTLSYNPIRDTKGCINGVLGIYSETTQKVLIEKQQKLKNVELATAHKEQTELNQMLQDAGTGLNNLNYELENLVQQRTSELAAANEELTAINEELIQIQDQLVERTNELTGTAETLRIATESAAVGTWSMTPEGVWLTSPQVKNIFGLLPQDRLTYADCLAQIRPDCVDSVNAAVQAARNNNEQFDVNYPITEKAEGTERWVHSIGKMITEEGPFKGHFFGALVDVTPAIHSQEAIERLNKELAVANEVQTLANEELSVLNKELNLLRFEAENTLTVAIDAAKIGTWNIDVRTRNVVANSRLKELFGLRVDEGFTLADYLDQITEDYRKNVSAKIEQTITENLHFDQTFTIRDKKDNGLRWVRAVGRMKPYFTGGLAAITGVMLDITEQKADEARKDAFIGMVSHELKTPLTSMNGYIQMLQLKAKKSEDLSNVNLLEKADKQVRKMTTMINGFLNISRLESGKILIEKQRFDLAQLIKETEEESIASISSHHIIFAPVLETWVDADRDKIGHVINNLISNAVKYSPANSTIKVTCITEDGKAIVSVKDEGMGVSAHELPMLFERYYRVNAVKNTTIAGFGIGLYLSSEIIKQHNGEIWAVSEPGQGSTFYFKLPTANYH